jgi:hypothetical protein
MLPISNPGDITHVIQLAIAPVFLLTAVGTLLMVLTNRLGRAADRRRVLTVKLLEAGLAADMAASARAELETVERRIHLIYTAIVLAVLCAIFVCLLIVIAFVDAFIAWNLGKAVVALFVLAMLALIASLCVFLREIFHGVNTARSAVR